MSEHTAESDAPACRSCYARTLSKDDRERFYAEPVTSCIYYCPEHQKVEDDLLARVDWSKIIVRKPGETLPPFARVTPPGVTDPVWHSRT